MQNIAYNSLYQVEEIQISYKLPITVFERPQITSTNDAYEILLGAWDGNKIDFIESAKVLLLNRAHYVLGIYDISTGGVAATVVDPKLIFMAELKANASCIILVHNHPSGSLKPSQADIHLTKKVLTVGSAMDLPVLDHLIIARNGYYSFKEAGNVLDY